ncbi:hypothetical protein N3K66_000331 [Trichothecium roseum]|uniref:Uncharacterized protein n=1 Tax=Trichothecium roseum TaxID=47278 RepID=A0ACC0VD38_9HYPO|nr:hypothetical protein N3K66_000331 [Trichothecium roseum]
MYPFVPAIAIQQPLRSAIATLLIVGIVLVTPTAAKRIRHTLGRGDAGASSALNDEEKSSLQKDHAILQKKLDEQRPRLAQTAALEKMVDEQRAKLSETADLEKKVENQRARLDRAACLLRTYSNMGEIGKVLQSEHKIRQKVVEKLVKECGEDGLVEEKMKWWRKALEAEQQVAAARKDDEGREADMGMLRDMVRELEDRDEQRKSRIEELEKENVMLQSRVDAGTRIIELFGKRVNELQIRLSELEEGGEEKEDEDGSVYSCSTIIVPFHGRRRSENDVGGWSSSRLDYVD